LRNLLVIGASDPYSLGARCESEADKSGFWGVVETAGIDPEETFSLNVMDRIQVLDFFNTTPYNFHDVICCAGINIASDLNKPFGGLSYVDDKYVDDPKFSTAIHDQLIVNALGPMIVFEQWRRYWKDLDEETSRFNFVAISSNSAHIARSGSTGYCMSKAALSMGIRCVARACAEESFNIWGYEPGFLIDTPMSRKSVKMFGSNPHRIPGNRTIETQELAERIISDIRSGHSWLNGCLLRTDGGEQ
jgi:NAD(P)-dependent dehydrogenase (short-subunit alcohol dehydrogenase family)